MSGFRRYGGLNYSSKNNVIHSFISNSEQMNINKFSGQNESHEIFKSDIDLNGNSILHTKSIQYLDGTIQVSAAGNTGATGYQGATGNTGAQGYTGDTGAQGYQGSTGCTGAQGYQGRTGDTGAQGYQGSTGRTGAQGYQGQPGINASFFNYQATTGTTLSPPSGGHIIWNFQTAQKNSSQIYISYLDNSVLKTDIKPLLNFLRTGDKFTIQDVGNSNNFQDWLLTSDAVGNDGQTFTILGVTYNSPASTWNAQPDNKDIIFIIEGRKGLIGFTGYQGYQGNTGRTGAQGYQGNTGVTGSQGAAGTSVILNTSVQSGTDYYLTGSGSQSGQVASLFISSTSNKIFFDSTGKITAFSFNATSDKRLKSGVYDLNGVKYIDKDASKEFVYSLLGSTLPLLTKEPINDYALSQYSVDNLKPKIYTMNGEPQIGFLADDFIGTNLEFLVNIPKNEDSMKSLNYIGLIGLLTHEIQSIKKQVAYLMEKDSLKK